jgi:chromosome segregation protein
MHHIKKLELIGFKSFCDRTQIVFHEGVTSIVGPNGCGKSNIADAISWVVGEQSAKSLRTDRMEGVIFAGTEARKATSLAEVVLTLSLGNSFSVPDGLELNPEGFTVARRLYRSGESEYYLDGRRARLKDIQALFEGTGLGPNSYALIEQGRIGQILSSRPADRRALIEEAARITLFKSRRYSAETKLELAQQNLLRVHDIIREVVRQLNSLRRQAAKARRYGRMRDDLRAAQRLKLGMEDRQVRSRLEECSARFAEAQVLERSMLAELARLDEARTVARDACLERETAVNQIRERVNALKVESGNAQNLVKNQESQRTNLLERTSELEREQTAIEERGRVVRSEQERLKQALQLLGEEIAREHAALEAEEARGEVVREATRQIERELDQVRSSLLNQTGRLADLKNLQARCQDNLSRIGARRERLEGERSEKARERAGLAAEREQGRRQWEGNAALQHEVAGRHADLEKRAEELAGRLESMTVEVNSRQEEYSLMHHRHSSLEEVEQARSNYSEGVQKFLSTRVPGEEARVVQTLADHIETDARYEKAVEDYLNDPLQFILVDGLEDAVQSVERLKRIGAGKCTFMTLRNGHSHSAAPGRTHLSGEGVVGYLGELLQMRTDVRHAFERALPEVASTVMVADLPTAFRVSETSAAANFLTLSGESYSPRGTLSAAGEKKSMAGFLALKREKRELQGKLEILRVKIAAARAEMAEVKEAQTSVAESLKSAAAELRRLEVEAVGIRHHADRLDAEISKIDQVEKVTGAEIAQLLAEGAEFQARLDAAATDIAARERQSCLESEEMREMNARLESLKEEGDELSRKLATLTSAHAVRLERKAGLESELRRLSGESDEVHKRLVANGVERAGTLRRIEDLQEALGKAQKQVLVLAADIEEAERMLAAQLADLAAVRDRLTALELDQRRLQSDRELALEARGRIEIEKARLESDLGHIDKTCLDEFHRTLLEMRAEIEEAEWQRSYEEVFDSYNQLKDRIENFGAINMRALEEYQELDERYQFLTKQRADIEQSVADTHKAIAEINRRSVEQFEDAFKNIRLNFIDVFQMLFKGGQCDLRLLDDGDVLESGIDIVAQPPGKKLQNVLLLSGGEKALTALALLIAIFRYRPSPFCVLDEVDAPLDDANVTRFAELISELSRDTQFLLVTHNKKTMEIAQTIYGVTMEEPGVSKIVGVDFRRRQALAS